MDILDCIVIGAGIQGSATTYHLAKRGLSVLMMDQFPLPHTRGSSHGASRIIRLTFSEPWLAKMALASYFQYRELGVEAKNTLIERTGILTVIPAATNGYNEMMDVAKKSKYAYEGLDQSQLQYKFHTFKNMEGYKSIYEPDAGVLMADKCLESYRMMILQYGGTIRDCEEVRCIEPGDVVTVLTNQGRYKARSLVITAGSWTNKLTTPLGLNLPLTVQRIRVCYWKTETDAYLKGTFPNVIFMEAVKNPEGVTPGVYALPSLEYPDHVKICLHGGPTVDPCTRDECKADWDLTLIKQFVAKHFSDVEPNPSITEMCMYTLTPDLSFILDHHPEWKNIVIGAGFSGNGFKMAPVVGEILADLATGKQCSWHIDPFKISRFHSSKL